MASDEGYLVRRFLAGMKDTALCQTFVLGYDDMTSVTVKDLNRNIQNIVGASSCHDVDSSDDEDDVADGDSSDEKETAKPNRMRAKVSMVSSYAATIRDVEERLPRMEMATPAVEVLTITNGQENAGVNQQRQQWGYGRPRQQGRSYQQYPNIPQYRKAQPSTGLHIFSSGHQQPAFTCYNCGKPGHISRSCREASQGRAQAANPIMIIPGTNGPWCA